MDLLALHCCLALVLLSRRYDIIIYILVYLLQFLSPYQLRTLNREAIDKSEIGGRGDTGPG
jgi:hypothetical protein